MKIKSHYYKILYLLRNDKQEKKQPLLQVRNNFVKICTKLTSIIIKMPNEIYILSRCFITMLILRTNVAYIVHGFGQDVVNCLDKVREGRSVGWQILPTPQHHLIPATHTHGEPTSHWGYILILTILHVLSQPSQIFFIH